MSQYFKVSRKGAVMSASRASTVLKPGTIIDAKCRQEHGLTDAIMREHLRSGYVVPFNTEIDPEELLHKTAPGVTVDETVRVKPDSAITTSDKDGNVMTSSGPKDDVVAIIPPNPAKTSVPDPAEKNPVGEPVHQDPTPWVLDPTPLAEKSLDELNVMISERDASIDPLDSKDDAIALLSQDFTPEDANVATG